MKRFLKESEFHFYLPHPCIIKIHGLNIGDETHSPSMILTLELQNLQNAIESGNLSNLQKCQINVEIVLGMRYIHSKNVIHRSLKPTNILISRKNHVKISDFGLANLDDPEVTKSNCNGSLLFMAPELLDTNDDGEVEFNNKIDVFAYGVILYYIVVNKLQTLNLSKVLKGIPPKFPPKVTEWVKNLIIKCQSRDPNERPSFSEIFKIIKSHNYDLFDDIIDNSKNMSLIDKRIAKIESFEFLINE